MKPRSPLPPKSDCTHSVGRAPVAFAPPQLQTGSERARKDGQSKASAAGEVGAAAAAARADASASAATVRDGDGDIVEDNGELDRKC